MTDFYANKKAGTGHPFNAPYRPFSMLYSVLSMQNRYLSYPLVLLMNPLSPPMMPIRSSVGVPRNSPATRASTILHWGLADPADRISTDWTEHYQSVQEGNLQQGILSEAPAFWYSQPSAPDCRRTGRPSGSIVINSYIWKQFTHKFGLDL